MKQLISLACMGVLCLLLSSHQVNAQVSRKGGQGSPKVILKKDKKETSEETSKRSEPEVSRERTTTTGSRTRTGGGSTYPDRRDAPTTRQEETQYPRRIPRQFPRPDERQTPRYPYPTDDRDEDRRRGDRRDRDGDYEGRRHRGGDYETRRQTSCEGNHHDANCNHPGNGKHLGWHKNKNKKKGKGKG